MTNSLQPRDRTYVKGYGFTKNMGKNRNSKYEQKFLDTTTDAFKTSSKKTMQKAAELICYLIANNTAKNNIAKEPKKVHIYIPPKKNESKLLLSFDCYNYNILQE